MYACNHAYTQFSNQVIYLSSLYCLPACLPNPYQNLSSPHWILKEYILVLITLPSRFVLALVLGFVLGLVLLLVSGLVCVLVLVSVLVLVLVHGLGIGLGLCLGICVGICLGIGLNLGQGL